VINYLKNITPLYFHDIFNKKFNQFTKNNYNYLIDYKNDVFKYIDKNIFKIIINDDIKLINNNIIDVNNNIIDINKRYQTIPIYIRKDIDVYHVVCIIIDNFYGKIYCIDTNKNNSLEVYDKLIKMFFEEYNYLIIYINLNINYKINNIQSKFFQGYCLLWSLYFCHLGNICSNDYLLIDYIIMLKDQDIECLNYLIESYSSYFFYNYVS
jgi:hypothetical protein